MLKKLFVSLNLIGLIIFTSCSDFIKQKSVSDISFSLGDRVANEITNSVGPLLDDTPFIITCSFDGIKMPKKTVRVTKASLATTKIALEDIPFDKEFKILLDVSYNGHVIYEGQSNLIKLNLKNDYLLVNIKIAKRKGIISYDKDGGNFTQSEKITTEYFIDDEKPILVSELPTPKKEGYVFEGWYFDKTCKSPVKDFGQTNYLGDVTLYAKWTPTKYKINYYSNIEFSASYSPDYSVCPQEYTIESQTITLPEPKLDGYTFIGWKKGPDYTSGITEIPNGSIGAIDLQGQWTNLTPSKITDFVVTKDPNNCEVICKWTNPDIGDLDKVVISYDDYDDNLTIVTKEVSLSSTVSGYEKGVKCTKTIPVSNGFSGTFGITVYDFGKLNSETTVSEAVSFNYFNLTKKPQKLRTEQIGSKTCDIVKFGDWPQTRLAANLVDSTVDTTVPIYINGWECYKGKTDNSYYAKIVAPESDNGYCTKDEICYVKMEPLEWVLITENYNGKKLLFSKNVIDAKEWFIYWDGTELQTRNIGGQVIQHNNYKYSYIRAYLNGYEYNTIQNNVDKALINNGFLQKAFVPSAQISISCTDVDNSETSIESSSMGGAPGAAENACENTQDRVFLLSNQEITNSEYGFNATEMVTKRLTDYTRIMGAHDNNIWWWLRSPTIHPDSLVSHINNEKQVSFVQGRWKAGVVPAIVVDTIEQPAP